MLDRELMRQIQAEEQVGNATGAELLRAQLASYKSIRKAGLIKNELPITAESISKQLVMTGEQKKALKARAKEFEDVKDFAFFTIPSKSIAQQLVENPDYFDFVNDSPTLRNLVMPLTFDMAIPVDKNKQAVPIANSSGLPLDAQREMDENFGKSLAKEGLKSVMVHAYALTYADITSQEQTGKKLIVGFYSRTQDPTVGPSVANVGRIDPDYRLGVSDWHRDYGHRHVHALPAVVPMELEIG